MIYDEWQIIEQHNGGHGMNTDYRELPTSIKLCMQNVVQPSVVKLLQTAIRASRRSRKLKTYYLSDSLEHFMEYGIPQSVAAAPISP